MVRASCILASCALFALLLVLPASAYPHSYNDYFLREDPEYPPEQVADILSRLQNLISFERKMENFQNEITNEKRALDLGLSRGYSGALQAKHMLGVSAANSAYGPGRRRRDAH